MTEVEWIQGAAIPNMACFGCGPANPQNLGVRSRSAGAGARATWTPSPHHSGGGGFLCGGIIGTVLDCHTGGAAFWWVKQNYGEWPADTMTPGAPGGPAYLTSGYEIKLLRPTPMTTVELYAEVVDHQEPELTVAGYLESEGKRRAEIIARWRRFVPR